MRQSWLRRWRQPIGEAAVIAAVVLGLFGYWFGVADRYQIFLYGHSAHNIPPARPFDSITASRHWMAGLVAGGAVMLGYAAVSWLRAALAARRRQPLALSPWWRVWLVSGIPLAVGIPAITMTLNSPTMPPAIAAACVVASLAGLALALLPGAWAATRPVDLLWLTADGLGLTPALILLRAIDLPGRGLSISTGAAWTFAIGSLIGGAAWLAGVGLLRRWRRRPRPGAGAIFLAGLGLSYLLLPLLHYLTTPPAYRYISTAQNFFALNFGVQCLALLAAAGLAMGAAAAYTSSEAV